MTIKEKILQSTRDIAFIEIGLMTSSLGTALFYSAGTGSSAMATFCDGLHLLLHTSYGDANTIANVALLILLIVLDRHYIDIGTILCVFTIGPWVNYFMGLLAAFSISASALAIKILCTVTGSCLMGIGLGMYMSVNRGYGALEGIVQYVRRKTGISVKIAKIIQDIILAVAGILLGAQWGIGTVIGIVLTGPVLQQSDTFFSPMLTSKKHQIDQTTK